MLCQEHCNLSRINDRTGVILGLDLRQAQAELLGNGFLDSLDRHLSRLLIDEVLEDLLRGDQVDFGSSQRSIGDQADHSSLELTNIASDIRRYEQGDIGRKNNPLTFSFLLKNGDLCLEVGRLNVG